MSNILNPHRFVAAGGGGGSPFPLTVADFERGNQEDLTISDANQTGLDITGDLTLAAWIKPESTSVNMGIMGKYNTSGSQRSYTMNLESSQSDRIACYFSNDGSGYQYVRGTTSIATGVWQHVIVTYDASAGDADIYINGVKETLTANTLTYTSLKDSTANFELGNRNTTYQFDGLMCCAGVWSKYFSQSDVDDLYNDFEPIPYASLSTAQKTNLQAYWNLDEESGTRYDSTDNDNDLTDVNTVGSTVWNPFTLTVADWEKGSSAQLSITDANQTGLDITGDITIAVWVNCESIATSDVLFRKWDSTGNQRGYLYQVASTNIRSRMYTSSDGSNSYYHEAYGSPYCWPQGDWALMLIKLDVSAPDPDIYRNASKQTNYLNTYSGATSIYNNTADFILGEAGEFDGKMCAAGIWSRFFDSSDVSELYNGGTPLYYADLSANLKTNLEGYWNLDETDNNTRVDSSGNGNDLTASNMASATWVGG